MTLRLTKEMSCEEQRRCNLTNNYETKLDDHWKFIASL